MNLSPDSSESESVSNLMMLPRTSSLSSWLPSVGVPSPPSVESSYILKLSPAVCIESQSVLYCERCPHSTVVWLLSPDASSTPVRLSSFSGLTILWILQLLSRQQQLQSSRNSVVSMVLGVTAPLHVEVLILLLFAFQILLL